MPSKVPWCLEVGASCFPRRGGSSPPRLLVRINAKRKLSADFVSQHRIGRVQPSDSSVTKKLFKGTFPKNAESTGDIERAIYYAPRRFDRAIFRGEDLEHPVGTMI